MCGNSQASALMATTMLGEKVGWAADARLFLQPREAFFEEEFTPLADDLARGIQACRDGVIVEVLGRVENGLGADDVEIR